MHWTKLGLGTAILTLMIGLAASAQELGIWHDKGDDGIKMIEQMAAAFKTAHPDLAKEFVSFIVTKPAQQYSLNNMGGVVRSDLETANVTPSLKPFVDPATRLQTDDFLSAKFPWFLELREVYYRKLIGAVSNPPKDWTVFIEGTADELRAEVERLKKKG